MSPEPPQASAAERVRFSGRTAGNRDRPPSKLRAEIDARQVRIVALDLPTSWVFASTTDDFPGRMFAAVNGMMLDVLAAVARKDYEDRRRRQAEGHAKAKAAGVYKGRPEDAARNAGIARVLGTEASWSARHRPRKFNAPATQYPVDNVYRTRYIELMDGDDADRLGGHRNDRFRRTRRRSRQH